MSRLLEHLFAAVPAAALFPRRSGSRSGEARRNDAVVGPDVPVRFRPRLISQLLQDHETLRALVRKLIGVCCGNDEDACVNSLREVAAAFRHASLVKATQLYPYLRWGLEKDRFAVRQLAAVHVEVMRSVGRVETMFEEYLGGPWLGEQRQRFVNDVVKVANLISVALKHEEAGVFPLYLPPGQYRHVRGAVA